MRRLLPVCSKSDLAVWIHLRSLQAVKGKEAWIWADLGVLASWGIPKRTYQQAVVNLAKVEALELDAQPGRKTRVRLKPIEPTKR
jgi:hypothetical protein